MANVKEHKFLLPNENVIGDFSNEPSPRLAFVECFAYLKMVWLTLVLSLLMSTKQSAVHRMNSI